MNFQEIVYYDESSHTGLRFLVTRNSRQIAHQPQGTHANRGYMTISIDYTRYLVHRIVWELHNGPIPDGLVIDHIDGNTSNNKLNNLRCISSKDNTRYGKATKLSLELVAEIRKVYKPYCRTNGQRALQKKYGVDHTTILQVIDSKTWQ